jgi:hypothetical protein
MKTFYEKYMLKQFIYTKPTLQKLLKAILHTTEEEISVPNMGAQERINFMRGIHKVCGIEKN